MLEEEIPIKKIKLTTWHHFLKEFKESEGENCRGVLFQQSHYNTMYCILDGKRALKSGAGNFNKVASNVYHAMPLEEKQRLDNLSATSTKSHPMSRRGIMKRGRMIFKKIQKQVETTITVFDYSVNLYGL